MAGLAFDGDLAAVSSRELPCDPESEPEAGEVARPDGPLESGEDAGSVPLGDADSVVSHPQCHVAVLGTARHDHGLFRAELDRIRNEVHDDLLDRVTVPEPRD